MSILRLIGPAVLVLLAATLILTSPLGISSIHSVFGATVNISLVGFISSGWQNSTSTNHQITITQGDTLVITTSSGDGYPHHFFVSVSGNGMSPNCSVDKCSVVIPPTHTDALTGFTQGTFRYYCEYHSKMTGTFNVLAPQTQDFRITANPSSLTINQGSYMTSTLTISSVNTFQGTVTLSRNAPAGITAALNTSTVSISPSSPKMATLNITVLGLTPSGSYTVDVTGTDSSGSQTASVQVAVAAPFSIVFDQSSLSVTLGSSGAATITLTSQNGFTGNVSLTGAISPSGPTVTVNPAKVPLTPGGSGTSTLTVTTSTGLYSSTPSGSYTITVTATFGSSLSRSMTLPVTVTSGSSPAATSIPVTALVAAGVAILAVIIVVALAILRKRPRK